LQVLCVDGVYSTAVFCSAAASSSNLSNKYVATQYMRMQAAHAWLQEAPALHYLACTEALARRFSNPRGQKRQEAGTPPICA